YEIFIAAGLELDTRGVAAEGMSEREWQLALRKIVGRAERLETPPAGCEQSLDQLVADVGGGQRHRHGTARAPEADAHPRSVALESFDCLGRNRSERLAHRWEDVENEVEAADLENFGDQRLQRGDHQAAAAAGSLPGGKHQAAQPGARHILEARQIEDQRLALDRKSTRLNSSHVKISYAVFCLKKKK